MGWARLVLIDKKNDLEFVWLTTAMMAQDQSLRAFHTLPVPSWCTVGDQHPVTLSTQSTEMWVKSSFVAWLQVISNDKKFKMIS
jgi:hypothetical protein